MIRTRTARAVRRLALTAAVLTVPLGLAACGTAEAGAAAVVGDRRISVADLQQATQEIRINFPRARVEQSQVLLLLIAAPYLEKAAADAGAGVSADDARRMLTQGVTAPSAAAIEVMRGSMVFDAISRFPAERQRQFITWLRGQIAGASITVNPRYGTIDPTRLQILPGESNWLVASSAQPVAGGQGADGQGTDGQGGQEPAPSPS